MATTNVEIIVPRKPKVADKPNHGPIERRREAEYLPRRLSPIVDVNFYDLGRLADGSDIPFSVAKAITKDANEYVVDAGNFTSANWQGLIDTFDPSDVSTWKETYRLIDDSEFAKFSLTFADKFGTQQSILPSHPFPPTLAVNGIELIDGVLKCKSSVEFGGFRSQLCSNLYPEGVHDPSDFKVTSVYSPAASSVSFSLRKNTDFFMVPRIFFEAGLKTQQYLELPSGRVISQNGLLNLLYRALPRSMYLDPDWPAGLGQSVASIPLFDAVSGVVKAAANARYYVNSVFSSTTFVSSEEPAPSTFPTINSPGGFSVLNSGIPRIVWKPVFGIVGSDIAQIPLGGPPDINAEIEAPSSYQLAAVALQGSSTFYFWHQSSGFLTAIASTSPTKIVRRTT